MDEMPHKLKNSKFNLARVIPLLVLILLISSAFYFRIFQYLSFENLVKNHDKLIQWTHNNYLPLMLVYMGIYIVTIALSIPGGFILTLTGGFLFGIVLGTIYVVVSATLGATIFFIIINSSLGKWFNVNRKSWVAKMEKGFQKNAVSYLLFLRLIPIFPFWTVNLVSALINVQLRVFFWSTLFGIFPGSLVYVSVGNSLSSVFSTDETPNFGIIFQPAIIGPLIALAILSLLPIIYKKLKK